MSDRAIPHPFTQEDAATWAHATTRMESRWKNAVTEVLLHLSMDINWSDALNMWVYTRERERSKAMSIPSQRRVMAKLNQLRAFGIGNSQSRYSEHLYRMLKDEERMAP